MNPGALHQLADEAEGLVPDGLLVALRGAAEGLATPAKWVVLGRVGAGKTTLVNRWALAHAPTGLGGITQVSVPHPVGEAILWDTPGIDDPDAAIVGLGDLLDGADGIVWVVDGLQPLTASERRVVAELVDDDTPRIVIVSRGDLLDPEDAAGVAARVHALAGVKAQVADLRHAVPTKPPLPVAPRRQQNARAAVDAIRAAVESQWFVPTLAALRLRYRKAIRDAVDRIEHRIDAGQLRDKGEALAALGREVSGVVDTTVADLPAPLPRLPHPAAPRDALVAQVLDRFSGQEGAHRVLKAEAARWLMEGQMELEEWWQGREDLQARAARVAAVRQRLAALATHE